MTVLPQLENELLMAHARRRGRWRPGVPGLRWGRAGTALAMAASVAVVAVVVAVVVTGHARVHRSPAHPRIGASGSAILVRGLSSPQAYSTGTSLYLKTHVSRPGVFANDKLMRVDPLTGRILASRPLRRLFDQALLASGTLWVTTSTTANATTLWGLDPATLGVRSEAPLTGAGVAGAPAGSMAVAGGWLWVSSENALERVSLQTGRVTRVVQVPAGGVGVASDAGGRVLLVSVGQDVANLEQRDPDTGALVETSRAFHGAFHPFIGGVVGHYAWLSQSGGNMGIVERIDLRRLAATGDPKGLGIWRPTLLWGTNRISARLIDGMLWVSQPAGGTLRNYCADPLTGRPRAPVRFGANAVLLAADARFIYYEPNGQTPYSAQIERAPIDPRCR